MTTVRRLSAIAAAVAALMALSACGGADNPAAAPAVVTSPTPTPTPTPTYEAALAAPADKWDEYQRLLTEENNGEDPASWTEKDAGSTGEALCGQSKAEMDKFVSLWTPVYEDQLEAATAAQLLFFQAYCPAQVESFQAALDDAAQTQTQYAVPVKADFSLTVKTLRKKCFGSAGCNIDYRVQLVSKTGDDFDPDITYELTYKVTGGEDTSINTLEMTGDSYSADDEESLSSVSSGAVLRAVITDVEEQ